MSKFRKLFKHDEGFTLIELLVVIAVLGILAAIAIPRLGGVTDKATLTEATSMISSLRTAQELYFVESNTDSYTDDLSLLKNYVDEDSLNETDWTISLAASGSGATASYTILVNHDSKEDLEAKFTKGDTEVTTDNTTTELALTS